MSMFPLPTTNFSTPLLDKLSSNHVGPSFETVIRRNRKRQELINAVKEEYEPGWKIKSEIISEQIAESHRQETLKAKQVYTGGEDAAE